MGVFWVKKRKKKQKQRRSNDIIMKQKCSALSPLLPDSVFALYCESSLFGVQQRPVTGPNPTPPPPPPPFCSAPRTGSYPPNTVMLRRTMTGPLDPQEMNPIDEPSRSAGQQVSASLPLQGEQGVLGQHAPSPSPPPACGSRMTKMAFW